ncbi:MAG: NADH-quinone oxidoreductase subunit N [Phycisphaerae bacterium]|nr:NADH-quinone oxidoreductase subunit N [Phycisphaerae bacterium]
MDATSYLNHLLPEIILIVGAAVTLFARKGTLESSGSAAPALALATLLAALVVSLWRGDPETPIQLQGLLITSLTYYVRLIGLGIGVFILLANWYVPDRAEHGEFFSLVLFSLSGLLLTASSNDLVVLFFAIELVSVPTYILIALSRLDKRASEASVKYFFLGALAAALMVYGFSFLYGAGGSTVLRDGSQHCLASYFAEHGELAAYAKIGLLLAFAGLFFKTAAVPFHFYAPDVYEGAASPISALLSFLPKLAGFVGLIHVMAVLDWRLPESMMWMLWWVAVLSMTVGNVLALLQSNVKRILAYSSIAHTGYMLIGLLVGPVAGAGPMSDGVAALLFYIAVYGAMNLGAFAVLAALKTPDGPVEELHELHGLSVRRPMMALVMTICAFSLMGFPPTAGFLGKVYIFAGAFSLETGHPFYGPLIALAIIGVINSAISAAYYLRIAAACYFGKEQTDTQPVGGVPMRVSLAGCGLALLLLFAWSSPLVSSAQSAARSAVLPDSELRVASESPTGAAEYSPG